MGNRGSQDSDEEESLQEGGTTGACSLRLEANRSFEDSRLGRSFDGADSLVRCSSQPSTPAGTRSPVRLLVLGDSWVRSDVPGMVTWPELLGEQLKWHTLNAAIPGSRSSTLDMQADALIDLFAGGGRSNWTMEGSLGSGEVGLHQDAWALVHAGGNDMLEGLMPDPVPFALAVSARSICCCSVGCCRVSFSEDVVANMEALAYRLSNELGVRNFLFCGLPLTTSCPLVAQLVQVLSKQLPYLAPVAPFVVHRLNVVHNSLLSRRLRRFRRRQSLLVCDDEERLPQKGQAVVLDEAAAIDAALTDMDVHWSDDGVHLTQAGHVALAAEMRERIRGIIDSAE